MCGCGHLVMVKVGVVWLQWGRRRCRRAIRRVEIAPSRDVLGLLSLPSSRMTLAFTINS
jgi:hypothetical protein